MNGRFAKRALPGMDGLVAKLLVALAFTGGMAPIVAQADAGDDQYAVAAGHYARGRWQFAVEEFRTFLKDFPKHSRTADGRFFQAEALVQLGSYPLAEPLFAQVASQEPASRFRRKAQFRVGECLYLSGKRAEAEPALARFLQEHPTDGLCAFALAYVGEIRLEAKDFDAARRHFDKALNQFPDGALQDDCRYGLARIHEEQGQADTAQRIYAALAAKTSSSVADDAQFRLGTRQYTNTQYRDALRTFEAFESTFRDSPLKSRARLGRAWSLVQLEQWDKAEKFFSALTTSQQVGIEARYGLGLVFKSRQQWSQAADELLAAAKMLAAGPSPEQSAQRELLPAIRFHAGDALRRNEKPAEAARQFDLVLKDQPDSHWIDDCLVGKLQLALSANDHAEVDRLADLFRIQHADSSLHDLSVRMRAQSLLARKQYEAAVEAIQSLADKRTPGEASPDPAELDDHYRLALAYQGLGQHEKAVEILVPVLKSAKSTLLADARIAQAASLVALERFSQAVQPLRDYLKSDGERSSSGDPSVRSHCQAQLVVCLARGKQLDEARQVHRQLVEGKPAEKLLAPATRQLAESFYEAGDYTASGQLFSQLISTTDDTVAARALSGLGWSRYKQGEMVGAAEAFDSLLSRFPQNDLAGEAAMVRGQILEQLKRPTDALAMFHRVIDQYGESKQVASAMLSAARLHDRLQQDRQAAQLYQRLDNNFADQTPHDAVLYEWAWVARELEDSKTSQALFSRLHQEHAKSRYWGDATYRLAESDFADHNYSQAAARLKSLLDAMPDISLRQHALFMQGQIAAARGEWDECLRFMQQFSDEYSQHELQPQAAFWIAESQYRQGQLESAVAGFSKLSTRLAGPNLRFAPMAALRRAQVLVQQKKWQQAQAIAALIGSQHPGFEQQFEVDYVLGRCHASRGEFDQARTEYRKVIGSKQGTKTETAAMAQWMIGETYFHQKNYQAALREYLRLEILYAYPTWQAAALLQGGKCSEQLGQWEQAAELYTRLIEQYPQSNFVEDARGRLSLARKRVARRP